MNKEHCKQQNREYLELLLISPVGWTVRLGGGRVVRYLKELNVYLTWSCTLIFLDLQWSKVILNYSMLTSGHSQKNLVKKGGGNHLHSYNPTLSKVLYISIDLIGENYINLPHSFLMSQKG